MKLVVPCPAVDWQFEVILLDMAILNIYMVRTSLDSVGKKSWSLQPKPPISDKCRKWLAFESNYTGVT